MHTGRWMKAISAVHVNPQSADKTKFPSSPFALCRSTLSLPFLLLLAPASAHPSSFSSRARPSPFPPPPLASAAAATVAATDAAEPLSLEDDEDDTKMLSLPRRPKYNLLRFDLGFLPSLLFRESNQDWIPGILHEAWLL